MKKLSILFIFTFTFLINAEEPSQELDASEESKILTSKITYLACERESSKNTVQDLLNGKILELRKKEKRTIKRKLNSGIIAKMAVSDKQNMIDGSSKVPLKQFTDNDSKNFGFLGVKIYGYVDGQNRSKICTSSKYGNLNQLDICKFFEKDTTHFFYKNTYNSNTITIKSLSLNRETLAFADYTTRPQSSLFYEPSYRYKCFISNKEELDILQEKYIDFIQPLQYLWNENVNEFFFNETKQEAKNKI